MSSADRSLLRSEPHRAVFMRKSRAVVAGGSIKEVMRRSVALSENAEIQRQAVVMGHVTALAERRSGARRRRQRRFGGI